MGKILNIFRFLFLFLAIINLLNCLIPEVGFDALWYHLTLPKLFLLNHQYFFPGGLLYYSAMPRLAELLFTPLIKYMGFVGPKLLQFLSGIFICHLLYRHSKKIRLSPLFSWLSVLMFYFIWVISWESSSGYIDLIRALFEYSAIYISLFGNPYLAGILIGLALSVKWHAIVGLLVVVLLTRGKALLTALPIFLPWMLIAKFFTGNYFYPIGEPFMIGTTLGQVSSNYFQFSQILKRILISPYLLTQPIEDYLSPLAGVFLIASVLCLLSSKKIVRITALIAIYGVGALLITPPPTSRYLIPYLPLLALSFSYLVSRLSPKFQKISICLGIASCLLILAGRSLVLYQNLPFLLGKETTNQYLANRSYKLPGTFIDSDSYMQSLPSDKKYLIGNLHNLYYFPYSFDHLSWASPENRYDYLITTGLKPQNAPGRIIHTNSLGIQFIKL